MTKLLDGVGSYCNPCLEWIHTSGSIHSTHKFYAANTFDLAYVMIQPLWNWKILKSSYGNLEYYPHYSGRTFFGLMIFFLLNLTVSLIILESNWFRIKTWLFKRELSWNYKNRDFRPLIGTVQDKTQFKIYCRHHKYILNMVLLLPTHSSHFKYFNRHKF